MARRPCQTLEHQLDCSNYGAIADALVYRSKTALAVLAAVVALGIPWYYVVKTIRNATPVESPIAASAVYWGDRWFPRTKQLSHWLHDRGVAYSVWAKRHPAAASRI